MVKRIFISIDLPKTVVEGLKKYHSTDTRVNWTKPENLHVTLNFLGAQEEENLKEIFDLTEAVAKQFQPQELTLDEARTHRKMIWATLAVSSALARMQSALQEKFLASGLLLRQNLHPVYTPH
ncbi:MAG: 2'-5' RNA ligase family protein, partial [Patescibacteria group bacterium]|nr:2'-5' RNA ligase family protein [Patescibacteria group bacterium]